VLRAPSSASCARCPAVNSGISAKVDQLGVAVAANIVGTLSCGAAPKQGGGGQ